MSYPAYPPPPQQPFYPPQGQQPYYPPQGQQPDYPPQQPQQPQQPVARGDISDFFEQPAASGKSISFQGKPPGTSYTGIVARTITKADIQVQTDMVTRKAATHPDGRLKYTMIVPLLVQPSAEFPDGRACYYFKHNEKPELERAMEAAGVAPGTPPEQGAVITITYTGDRPVPGMSPQKMKSVTYTRPQGANGQPAAFAAEPAVHLQQQQPAVAPPQPADYQQPWAPAPGTPPQYAAEQYAQTAPPPQPVATSPQSASYQEPAATQAQPGSAPVAGLTEAQQKLLAQLTGQQ